MYKKVGIGKIVWILISLIFIILGGSTIIEYMQIDESLRNSSVINIVYPNIELTFLLVGIFIVSLVLAIRFSIKEYTMPLEVAKARVRTKERTKEEFKERLNIKQTEPPSFVTCPKCGSTQIQAMHRGWKLTTGFIGSSKIERVCLNCKNKF